MLCLVQVPRRIRTKVDAWEDDKSGILLAQYILKGIYIYQGV